MSVYHKVKKNPILLVWGAAVAMALALVAGIVLAFQGGGRTGQVVEGPVEGYTAAQHENDADTLSFRLNTRPQFSAEKSEGMLYLENPAENQYDIQVDLELMNGDVLYSSPVLSPNTHVDAVRLSMPMSGGIYDAQARIFAIDRDSGVIVGQIVQDIRVIVE